MTPSDRGCVLGTWPTTCAGSSSAEEQPRREDAEHDPADVRPVGDTRVHRVAEAADAAEELQDEPGAEDDDRGKLDPGDEEEEHERRDAGARKNHEVGAE